MTTLYEKRGRRYVPVHDTACCDGLGDGTWVVDVEGGRRVCLRAIDPGPTLAALAAIPHLVETITHELLEASRAEPRKRPATPRERRAWEAYCREMGGEATLTMCRPSARDVAERVARRLVERVESTEGRTDG